MKPIARKQYVESSYPGRDGIGADIKVWNLCERCGDKLKPGKEVWLELDTRTNTFTDEEVPTEHSQGGFTFGKACARKQMAEHKGKKS